MSSRHFPPPWTVDELDACFVVIDNAGRKLSYVYHEEEPQPRAAAKLLTKDPCKKRNFTRVPPGTASSSVTGNSSWGGF